MIQKKKLDMIREGASNDTNIKFYTAQLIYLYLKIKKFWKTSKHIVLKKGEIDLIFY